MNNEIKHSEDFIRNTIGNKTGFTTPKNYLNEFENNTFSTFLENNIQKETKFNIPSDYFNNLEEKILAKVSSEVKEVKVISFKDRVLRFIPAVAAASVLLFIGLNYFTNTKTTFDDITIADLETWYENDIENINSSELAMVFETADFEEDTFSETIIKNENLEEYLNSIDHTSLLIE